MIDQWEDSVWYKELKEKYERECLLALRNQRIEKESVIPPELFEVE